MNYKQEIIKDLIEQLSNIEKESYRTTLQHFKAWLKQGSLILKAANMEDQYNIWEESLKANWTSPFDNVLMPMTIPTAQKNSAKTILLAFLNNLNCEDKPSHLLFPMEIVQDTRDYVSRIAKQVNICYTNGCYDACAVMLRRLIETLIIECYEKEGIQQNIKDSNNQYLNLDAIITSFTNEPKFNLSRDTKNNLRKLKEIGDKSAHNRYFTASQNDVDKLAQDIRVIIPELVEKSGVRNK